MKQRNRWMVLVMASVLGAGIIPRVSAQDAKPEPAQPAQKSDAKQAADGLVTLTYNVGDIVRNGHDYPFDSAIIPPTIDPDAFVVRSRGITRRGLFPGNADDASSFQNDNNQANKPMKSGIGIDQLCLVIQRTVDMDSWRWDLMPGMQVERKETMVGTIQPLGTLLIVTQTPDNQKRVMNLLNSIRSEYGPMQTVGVNLRWVQLDPAQVRQLIGDQKGSLTIIDPAQLDKLPAETTWAAGQTTCFSGQTVFVSSGRGRTWVHHVTPVVGTNAVAYDATAQLIQSGAVIQVTPLLSPDGATAVLDLTSVVSDWGSTGKPYSVGGAAGEATTRPADQISAAVDRLNVGVQQLRTTVRLPVGKMVLVGGMTREPGTDTRQLYLLAEVRAGD